MAGPLQRLSPIKGCLPRYLKLLREEPRITSSIVSAFTFFRAMQGEILRGEYSFRFVISCADRTGSSICELHCLQILAAFTPPRCVNIQVASWSCKRPSDRCAFYSNELLHFVHGKCLGDRFFTKSIINNAKT